MLSREDNELLTRVGPSTPLGGYMRRFWIPAMLEEELPGPDCDPVRLRLLGEDLVAFRDTNGRVGVLDAYCPHRLAHLYYGRNEECGIRCIYHGWKFDVEGNCVDMPSEPEGDRLKKNIKTTSYPAALHGGMFWVYMGPKDKMPALPDFDWARGNDRSRVVRKRLYEANYLQSVEGGLDSAHISFLHRSLKELRGEGLKTLHQKYARNGHPIFDVRPAKHGLLVGARRNAEDETFYWRVTPFSLPFYMSTPPILQSDPDSRKMDYSSFAWVPIDDETTATFSIYSRPYGEFSDEELERLKGPDGVLGHVGPDYRGIQNKSNDYMMDRKVQRTENFTGIRTIQVQDQAVTESMGPIAQRWKEHLGSTDLGIVHMRRLLKKEVENLQKGIEPEAPHNPSWFNVRPASIIMDRKADWVDGSMWLINRARDEAQAAE
jgi:phenylpropionate dioxygenase-like ring-hydroxylating dioxygenase large terminal subunit